MLPASLFFPFKASFTPNPCKGTSWPQLPHCQGKNLVFTLSTKSMSIPGERKRSCTSSVKPSSPRCHSATVPQCQVLLHSGLVVRCEGSPKTHHVGSTLRHLTNSPAAGVSTERCTTPPCELSPTWTPRQNLPNQIDYVKIPVLVKKEKKQKREKKLTNQRARNKCGKFLIFPLFT